MATGKWAEGERDVARAEIAGREALVGELRRQVEERDARLARLETPWPVRVWQGLKRK